MIPPQRRSSDTVVAPALWFGNVTEVVQGGLAEMINVGVKSEMRLVTVDDRGMF